MKSIDPTALDPTARVCGQSLLLGERSRIGPGAVIENSYLENVVVEAGARISDSILITAGKPKKHRCDAAGTWVASGSPVTVGKEATIQSCLVRNTAVGRGSHCNTCVLEEGTVGDYNSRQTSPGYGVVAEALTDSWRHLNPDGVGQRHPTWAGDGSALDMRDRIDHVFVSDGFEVVEAYYVPVPESETDHPAHWVVLGWD